MANKKPRQNASKASQARSGASNDQGKQGKNRNKSTSEDQKVKPRGNQKSQDSRVPVQKVQKQQCPVPDQDGKLYQPFGTGNILTSSKNIRWMIKREIGKGGFGVVYKVYCNKYKDFFAMKTEKNPYFTDQNKALRIKTKDKDKENDWANKAANEKMMMRLQVEVAVLKELNKQDSKNRKHFAKIYDMGQVNDKEGQLGIKFFVMSLLGESLVEIQQRLVPQQAFTMCTVFKFAIQVVEALSHLHALGYIHRDLKPGNFSPGIGDSAKIVYLLDFGLVKRIAQHKVLFAKTRQKAHYFLGTEAYASVQSLRLMEQCFGDDMESLLYVVCELLDKTYGLPWFNKSGPEMDKSNHWALKERFMNGDFEIFKEKYLEMNPKANKDGYIDVRIPDEFKKTVALVKAINYGAFPNYGAITKSFEDIAAALELNLKDDFDWIGLYEYKSKADDPKKK